MAEVYPVPVLQKQLKMNVTVPGSKSETNRALLLSSLSDGVCRLKGVQFSDDSRHFLSSLQSLGFSVEIREAEKEVMLRGEGGRIPQKTGEIHVGSAGTAARFLTAMLSFSEGNYRINCSEQMAGRPMEELFVCLEQMGAEFAYLGEKYHLPVEVRGIFLRDASETTKIPDEISLDISRSTQYLSALMLTASMLKKTLSVRIISEKKKGSYIEITRQMLSQFGVKTEFSENGAYIIHGEDIPSAREYEIEPDVSGACYFYGAAALTGGETIVRGVHPDLMQGDMKFLEVLRDMGCEIKDSPEGMILKGPENGLSGVDVMMNDFSDQALTLASMAPFAKSPVTIRGIAHIRNQECDRVNAIVTNLRALGVAVEELEDGVRIAPAKDGEIHGAEIETFGDHRVAMAFTLPGLLIPGVVIKDPGCCRKTFENYFEIWDSILR